MFRYPQGRVVVSLRPLIYGTDYVRERGDKPRTERMACRHCNYKTDPEKVNPLTKKLSKFNLMTIANKMDRHFHLVHKDVLRRRKEGELD